MPRDFLARPAALAVALVLAAGIPGRAQTPSVDTLLARIFASEDKDQYELTADFSGTLTLTVRGSRVTAIAAGSYLEYRKTDGIKRRKVTITKLDLPLLLKPFAGSLRRLIEERIEIQSETPETFHAHDIFIVNELPVRRFVLIGVHRAIVDDAIDRYGTPQDKKDPAIRRKIAQWLYTAPTMRDTIARPGPPYALRVIVDEQGLLYELTLFYNWGEIGTRITYAIVNGQAVWRQVSADAISELTGLGRVNGELQLTFTNHCVNCKKP